jgi:hypothetical protein
LRTLTIVAGTSQLSWVADRDTTIVGVYAAQSKLLVSLDAELNFALVWNFIGENFMLTDLLTVAANSFVPAQLHLNIGQKIFITAETAGPIMFILDDTQAFEAEH